MSHLCWTLISILVWYLTCYCWTLQSLSLHCCKQWIFWSLCVLNCCDVMSQWQSISCLDLLSKVACLFVFESLSWITYLCCSVNVASPCVNQRENRSDDLRHHSNWDSPFDKG